MSEHKSPPKLDVRHAAQSSLRMEGYDLLSNYERLMQETHGLGGENVVNWTAMTEWRPNPSGQPFAWLHLTVQTCFPQVCQRCLTPVDITVQIDREFRFVESEAVAEQQDDESEEDLLVASREFDLAGLIEDEILMGLPLVPRHDNCPVRVKLTAVDEQFDQAAQKPNPFSVLSQLKDKDSAE
ncbi:YceD family protein [Rhodoferax sp.]|uniref:YceD family protein n=1 Tax=Rhodoferax sp. TaxID=50421 RepID=UPI002637364D|nr:YceD family protein [Rhodoferax sp.]MDD2924180.1 YceD family protein [Rhodoferax sp.]